MSATANANLFPPIPSTRLGMLTPSSNSVLEPTLMRMTASLPDVSLHFGRFRVTEISLGDHALGQFDDAPILAAADLLADARVASLCWNGTSAGWLGFDRDRALCAALEARTGIPATSSVLALDALFRRAGVRRFGLVTPYLGEVQDRIIGTFAAAGYECVAERHAGEHVNFAFAAITPEAITDSIRSVARSRPDAIVVFCTNMWGAVLANALEEELDLPIFDTVATGLWGGLVAAGTTPTRPSGWGRLFSM